jgi:hypothetical protein
MANEHPSSGEREARQKLTPAEIDDTFTKLGLADPEVRRFFQTLGQPPAGEDDSTTYWTELHSGTNFARSQSHDA